MRQSALVVAVLLVGCKEDPGTPTDTGTSPTDGVTNTDTQTTPPGDADTDADADGDTDTDTTPTDTSPTTAVVHMAFTSVFAQTLPDGEACIGADCTPLAGSAVDVVADVLSDVAIDVTSSGSLPLRMELHTEVDDVDLGVVIAPSAPELATIATTFAVPIDPKKAMVGGFVFSSKGIAPSISGNAVGPLYFDGYLHPLPAATQTNPGYAWYLFVNVDPGNPTLTLPGCNEPALFQGTPGDGAIAVTAVAGTLTTLPLADCG